MLRVGINGFGRIGRAVFRINHGLKRFAVTAVNDLDPNVENFAYLLRYDTTYGRFPADVHTVNGGIMVDGEVTRFFAADDPLQIPWEATQVDVLIEATGVQRNVQRARQLVEEGRLRAAIITWAPSDGVDITVVFGVNEGAFRPGRHRVLSASICDANAAGPVLKVLDEQFGVRQGFVTTLHPWLSYQNLLDAPVSSVANPGHFWTDFSLGRASPSNLIPKPTTLVQALSHILPEVAARLDAISFRVPTAIVTASDMTIHLRRPTTADELNDLFRQRAASDPVFGYQTDPLVSVDFAAIEHSLVVDGRWTRVRGGTLAKLVLWYDNEWGYSRRVVDLVSLVGATTAAAGRPAPRSGDG